MDACGVRRVHSRQTRTPQRTAKSCGPGAATLASIRPARAGTATVATKAVHRGEHEVSRKAIARGKPGCLGCTCQTRVHSLLPNRTRRCGRSQRPAFPVPSVQERDNELASPGRKRVAGMSAYVSASPAMTEIGRVSARPSQPFSREKPHRGVRVHRLAEGKALRVLAAELVELDGVGI